MTYDRVLRKFFKTTTLHGFKYLVSKHYLDIFMWAACCIASACCAAVLCAVVWARFLQEPALLTVKETPWNPYEYEMPMVAICPPFETVSRMFVKHFRVKNATSKRLPEAFENILRRRYIPASQVAIVSKILNKHNLTVTEALFKIMPHCDDIVTKCRWQNVIIPCRDIFAKNLTQWGVCCVAMPLNLGTGMSVYTRTQVMRELSLVVQCKDEKMSPNCKFFTKYDVEEWFEPVSVSSGHAFNALLDFVSVQDKDSNKLVDGTCALEQKYSRSRCLLKCFERLCGCLDVIRLEDDPDEIKTLPTCPLHRVNCLRSFNREKNTCNCLPTCKKVVTSMMLESSPMNAIADTIDDFYSDVDVALASVINIRLSIRESTMFTVKPTETWITMLSSLGGIFNMFLGVGFFSALEILFFVLIRVPIVMRRSTEIRVIK